MTDRRRARATRTHASVIVCIFCVMRICFPLVITPRVHDRFGNQGDRLTNQSGPWDNIGLTTKSSKYCKIWETAEASFKLGIEAEAIKDDVERRRQLGEMQGRSELFHTLSLIICCPAKAEFILIVIMIGCTYTLVAQILPYSSFPQPNQSSYTPWRQSSQSPLNFCCGLNA